LEAEITLFGFVDGRDNSSGLPTSVEITLPTFTSGRDKAFAKLAEGRNLSPGPSPSGEG
jgi:hypothetical protein